MTVEEIQRRRAIAWWVGGVNVMLIGFNIALPDVLGVRRFQWWNWIGLIAAVAGVVISIASLCAWKRTLLTARLEAEAADEIRELERMHRL
jgi:hypothetical protein